MEEFERLRTMISQLLKESPLTSEEVIADIHHLMGVGEEELAFDTMCSWIYEDNLSISPAYYKRLVSAALELGTSKSINRLDELIEE